MRGFCPFDGAEHGKVVFLVFFLENTDLSEKGCITAGFGPLINDKKHGITGLRGHPLF